MTADIVFDKAKWHFGGDFPRELSDYQGYIHTGFYLGWLMVNDLLDEDFKKECQNEILFVQQQKLSPVQFYQDFFDGVFDSEYLTQTACDFTKEYFDFGKGQYIKDYEDLFCKNLPTVYHVVDSLQNFNAISKVIDKRYKTYLKKVKPNTVKRFFQRLLRHR